MKGLRKYLGKHGYHFTEKLVKDIIPIKWSYSEIEKAIKDKVWFNCWSATAGDILYLANHTFHIASIPLSKRFVLKCTMGALGNYELKEHFFRKWLEDSSIKDITPYI